MNLFWFVIDNDQCKLFDSNQSEYVASFYRVEASWKRHLNWLDFVISFEKKKEFTDQTKQTIPSITEFHEVNGYSFVHWIMTMLSHHLSIDGISSPNLKQIDGYTVYRL